MKWLAWTILTLVCLFAFVSNLLAQDFNFQAINPITAPFNAGLVATSTKSNFLNTNLGDLRNTQINGFPTMNTIDVGMGDINGDGITDIFSLQANPQNNTSQEKDCLLIFIGTGDGTFQIPRVINTFAHPISIDVNDVDTDGLADVVIAEDGFIEIFTGLFFTKGIVGFDRFGNPNLPHGALTTKAGNRVISSASGFLDEDSILDIAVVEQGPTSGEVEVFFTNITGVFNPVADLNFHTAGSILGQSSTAKAIAIDLSTTITPPDPLPDIDFDIFVATSLGVEVFENTLPTFTPVITLVTAGSDSSLITADVNLDGVPDIIAVSQQNSRFSIFQGNLKGGYLLPKVTSVNNPIAVSVLNFNNDDLPDVAVLQALSPTNTAAISIFPGNKKSLLGTKIVFNKNSGQPIVNPAAMMVGQMMPSGEQITLSDIVVAEKTLPSISTGGVLFLSSQINYTPVFLQIVSTISQPSDFDGDGLNNDIALIEQNLGIIYLLYNISTSGVDRIVPIAAVDLFTQSNLHPTSLTTFPDAVTGLNNLAITLAGQAPNLGQLIILPNDGSGSFDPNNQPFRQFVATSSPTNILSTDFNNDGVSDLVYIDYTSNLVVTATNDGTNLFLDLKFRETGGFIPVSATIGDVNDDDIPDLMVLNQGNLAQGNQSLVSVMLGKIDGSFLLSNLISVPNIGISIVGGKADLMGDGTLRMVDFNSDGLPDFAVASTRTTAIAGSFIPSVTILLNQPSKPGNFIVQPPIPLLDPTLSTIPNTTQGLRLEDRFNGPGITTGRSGQTSPGLAVGGANFLMSVGDFNADGSPDLVVTGTQVNQGNFRSAIYLVGNATAGTMRVVRPQRSAEYGTNQFFRSGADTFVGCVSGRFTSDDLFNSAADVLHVSLNGSIWIDANDTRILNHAPRVAINREDLNADFGQGRKEIVTAGEIVTIPINSQDADNDPITFHLVPTPSGEQPPEFITIDTTGEIPILTIDSSHFSQPGPSNKVFHIALEATDSANKGTGGRLPLFSRDYFTLVVQPNTPPIIQPIPEQTVAVDDMVTVPVMVSDREHNDITLDVSCDKNQFVTVDGHNLVIAPTIDDLGLNVCAVTATDNFGLSSSVGLTINVVPAPKANPMIDPIDDQNIAPNETRDIMVNATDPEGDTHLKLTLVTAPDFVTLVDNGDGTGTLTLMPDLFSPAHSMVTIQVATSDNRFATTSFNIIIQGVFITDVSFIKGKLNIQGRDYGMSGAIVIVNDKDVSKQIINQTNFSITLRARTRKKLNLHRGDNLIQVMIGDVISDPFTLTIDK